LREDCFLLCNRRAVDFLASLRLRQQEKKAAREPTSNKAEVETATRLQAFLDRVNFSSTPNKTGHCVIHELSVL
jgi:hypothetical protein